MVPTSKSSKLTSFQNKQQSKSCVCVFLKKRKNSREVSGAYSVARYNNHSRSEAITVIQITGDVQVTLTPSLPRRLKALRERQISIAIPAPKCRNMPPLIKLQFLLKSPIFIIPIKYILKLKKNTTYIHGPRILKREFV